MRLSSGTHGETSGQKTRDKEEFFQRRWCIDNTNPGWRGLPPATTNTNTYTIHTTSTTTTIAITTSNTTTMTITTTINTATSISNKVVRLSE